MNSIQANMKRASAELILLSLLCEGEKYGYQLAQEIKQRSGGKLSLLEGSMYTILNRLKDYGDVTFRSEAVGPKKIRVYYKITESGKARREEMYKAFDEYFEIIHEIIK